MYNCDKDYLILSNEPIRRIYGEGLCIILSLFGIIVKMPTLYYICFQNSGRFCCSLRKYCMLVSDYYNFHSHTQFCDGRASMEEMARAAAEFGMLVWGFSPHSPICVESPCNITRDDVAPYLEESNRLKDLYYGMMEILTAMEIDFISRDFGAHIDYFLNLPLDYRIGSVHFVPNQEGIPIDCDGSSERFIRNLKTGYNSDLRYVVEKFFEQELTMIELGGFDILGHFDKIAANACAVDPDIESYGWYGSLIKDVISNTRDKGISIEINTKAFETKNRLFPSPRWWDLIIRKEAAESADKLLGTNKPPTWKNPLVVNSDAHYPDKINSGREETLRLLREHKDNK